MPPMVAIPTTAGTGSEAGRGALIQLPQTGRKTIVLSPYLLPSVGDLRPRADPRPAAGADRRRPAWTPSRTASRATSRRPSTRSATASRWRGCGTSVQGPGDGRARRLEPRGPDRHDDGGLARRDQLPQGAGRRPLAVARPRAPRVACITGRSTRSCCRTPCGSTARPPRPRIAELAARLGLGRSGDGAGHLITLTELVLARLPLPRRLGELDGLAATGSPSTPGSPCSTTATGPTPAPAPSPTSRTCSRAW